MLRHLERKGLHLGDFLAWQEKGKLPLFRVETSPGEYLFFFSEKEWRDYRDQHVATQKAKLLAEKAEKAERAEKAEKKDAKPASETGGVQAEEVDEEALEPDMQELWEMAKMAKLADNIKHMGLDLKWYDVTRDDKTKPLFHAKTDRAESEGYSLKDLLETVREAGRSGSQIQRYKGLGEMNPDQLWETTMDPKRRKLLQVKIVEVADTENAFTTLMGDKVEPRRAFIEKHAKEVRNLDI